MSGPKSNTPSTRIAFKNKSLGSVTQESLDAVAAANQPPTLFQQNGHLVRIRPMEDEVIAETLTLDTLRYHLGRAADFVRNGAKPCPEPPPLDFVRDLLASPKWDEEVFPSLKGIVQFPFFTAGGELVTSSGYHHGSRLWYEPDAGLKLTPVPDRPTTDDINQAKQCILSELLHDFPFQKEADRTNAVAYLLTPFLREMISGQVPMAVLEAPVAGTGKGLLANAVAFPSTGVPLETIPQRESDEEWRKAITAKLIELPSATSLKRPFTEFGNTVPRPVSRL